MWYVVVEGRCPLEAWEFDSDIDAYRYAGDVADEAIAAGESFRILIRQASEDWVPYSLRDAASLRYLSSDWTR